MPSEQLVRMFEYYESLIQKKEKTKKRIETLNSEISEAVRKIAVTYGNGPFQYGEWSVFAIERNGVWFFRSNKRKAILVKRMKEIQEEMRRKDEIAFINLENEQIEKS